ncbi:MAG: TonB-dependent receptor plug domain-containing protein [Paludibacteraceae bacterium]|nr:TonB-dependent receptor plug domain-containing protein [Paludibacteraceae bacterium]
MRRTVSIVFFTLLCVVASAQTSATDSLYLDSIYRHLELDEYTVTARVKEKDIIIPQTLSGTQLKKMNALSVADAIRYFSGVQIKDYGGVGGLKTVNIRSMGTNHMGVYYNGIQLGNAQNGQIDLGKYSLENIEEIQLYNGQKSDIWQSAREFGAAGSIYLTTRRPRFDSGKTFNIKGQMRAGSFDLINPSILLDVKLSETMSLTTNAELVSSSGKYPFRYRRVTPSGELAYDTTAIRQNGDINAIRVEAALNHYYSNTGFWKLQLYHYNSERGVPGAIVNNVWRNGERLWDRNSFVQATWQDEIFNRWSVRVNAKYANDYTRYINNDNKLIHVENQYLQQEAYLTMANKVNIFDWWDVSVAYDMQYNALSMYMDAHRFTHWLSVATAINIKNYLRVQASALGTFVNEEARDRDEAPNTAKFTPAFFLSYRPSQVVDLRFNAFYKQSYRYPTFNDLYYTDMGNAYLKPELAKQHNVGLSFAQPFRVANLRGSEFRINADYYYNRISDKIIAYPKGQQFRWTMLNLGLVKINGLDINTHLHFNLPKDFYLTAKLQYTYQTAIDVTDPSDNYYGHQIPYIPWHSGSAVGMFGWNNDWMNYHLNYSFIYVGERYNQQENILYNYTQPWYTHDLSLVGEWDIYKAKADRIAGKNKKLFTLRAALDINNVLSQDYDVILNYPMPKRNYKCTISITY